MTAHLSDDQRQALRARDGTPVAVVDAETRARYVLLSAESYGRVRPLLEVDAFSIRESYSLQEQVARTAGWDDPAMDAYDQYQAPRQTR